ncbi:3-dehydroquinate synthase [Pedobacter sp. Leaf170]|uniref:3-dehydroquinate synthase n=1 Tax=Pedobacter sp. Leaf170 TaxID=2876558 RepID=UPI001E477029|nr:3-dehydroquinate synthase [Pedobacter sp. Leaf170]
MEHLKQSFTVEYRFNVFFTSSLFSIENLLIADFLEEMNTSGAAKKIFFVMDSGVASAHPELCQQIKAYFKKHNQVELVENILIVPGGEIIKNETKHFDAVLDAVNSYRIDRHSYIAAIGGGALLDMVGYAATVAHRGIKHIRIPTTVLSQNDSGIGVKNGINYFNKKNFLGTFSPPVAVFNDEKFLSTLSDRDWRSGIAEAVKVALIKDLTFFEWLENNAKQLADRNLEVMNYQIWKCAALHMDHIKSGDPFERGSARPLDFGHWSAHKLEYLTNFEIRHGEAVAMGIALDTVYSNLAGMLSTADTHRVLNLLTALGFELTHPLLQVNGDESLLLKGLEEFREHLGGELTITLLSKLGVGIEVHEMDAKLLQQAALQLNKLSNLEPIN